MTFRSDPFYYRVFGPYAIWATPASKGGGERFTYSVPTKQALTGITDMIYWKPVLENCVEEVKVMNRIQTQTMGVRALLKNGKSDLNYCTYLRDVEYLVKYRFRWNEERQDLAQDRNEIKHEQIILRSLDKGGRRDVFLGSRECVAYVERLNRDEYERGKSFYEGQTLNLGVMFHSFRYPKDPGGKLESYFTETVMKDGVITFKPQDECEIKNILSSYDFKYPMEYKSVDEELREMEEEDRR